MSEVDSTFHSLSHGKIYFLIDVHQYVKLCISLDDFIRLKPRARDVVTTTGVRFKGPAMERTFKFTVF
ncbi:hypothetical protein D3C84_995830 [compost metagenome]